MNTKDRGELTEAKVKAKLIEEGLTVLEPVGENNDYDLVVEKNGNFERIQVKTAFEGQVENTIMFKTCRTRANMSVAEDREYDEVDAFVAYHPETDNYYWVDDKDAPKSKMTLRFEETKNGQKKNVNMAKDYGLSMVK